MKINLPIVPQKSSAKFKKSVLLKPVLSLLVLVTVCASGCKKQSSLSDEMHTSSSVVAEISETIKPDINLGSASCFTIFSQTGITTTGVTKIEGNIGVGPIASTAMTGFGLEMSKDNSYSTSVLVPGYRVYAPDYERGTPLKITKAMNDIQTAFDEANLLKANVVEYKSGNITGAKIVPGVYNWATSVLIDAAGVVTLTGNASDIYVFQIGTTLTVGASAKINLGKVNPANVYWIVGTAATFGTNVIFNGSILAKTAITLEAGDIITGHLFAQTAVTMIADNVAVKR